MAVDVGVVNICMGCGVRIDVAVNENDSHASKAKLNVLCAFTFVCAARRSNYRIAWPLSQSLAVRW
jgi:hypothetical protein